MVLTEQQKRDKASSDAKAVYQQASQDVTALVKAMPDAIRGKWDAGIKIISSDFETSLAKVKGYINQRYAEVGGWLNKLGDSIFGLPDWIVNDYKEAERKFGREASKLALDLSTSINGTLLAIDKIIKSAKARIDDIFNALGPDLAGWAAEQKAGFEKDFAGLRENAHKQAAELQADLLKNTVESVQDARKKIEELREATKGLLDRIKDAADEFAKDPAKFIINGLLKILGIPPDAFWAVVAKIQQAVKDIADNPMGFANNLMAGISQGFKQFFDHIGTHLIKGMLEWLLSGMKDAGLSVAVPKDFSLRSVVTFFFEILGISWPRIRKLLVEQLGEKTVGILEKAGGVIAAVVTKGLSGIWEEVQAMLEPKAIIDAIIDAAIKYIIETVVVKVAARIIMLFNPAGAIAQAIEAIYRVLKWIFTNAARIFHLVEAVVNGIADVIAGNIGGVAKVVESALAMLIAPVLDFIADYIGLGGLPGKVAEAVKGLQGWVEGILRKVIAWLVAQGKKLLAALGFKEKDKDKDKDKKGADTGEVGERVPFSGGGESHTLYVKVDGSNATLMVASRPMTVASWLDGLQKRVPELEKEKQNEASSLIGQARGLITKTDQEADLVAQARASAKAAKPGPEGITSDAAAKKNDDVKSDEEQLAAVLAEIATMFGEGQFNKEDDRKNLSPEGDLSKVSPQKPSADPEPGTLSDPRFAQSERGNTRIFLGIGDSFVV